MPSWSERSDPDDLLGARSEAEIDAIKVGLIGCGDIGTTHLEAWEQVPDAQVMAVCDANEERMEHVAAAYGIEGYLSSVDMIEETELDAVDICVPPKWHREIALFAMEEGLHVICENPLARSASEAREIVEVAEREGMALMTAFCHRFDQPVMMVQHLLEKGTLGRLHMFRGRLGTYSEGIERRWLARRSLSGGGVLMDLGIHLIDLFRYLMGEIKGVQAQTHAFRPEIRGVEDSAAVLIESEGGGLGVIEVSWATDPSENGIELYGERGTAIVDYTRDEIRYKTRGAATWTRPELTFPNRYMMLLRHFTDVLLEETEPLISGWDGLRALEVIEDAYLSARGS